MYEINDVVTFDYHTIHGSSEMTGVIEKFSRNGKVAFVRVPYQGVNCVPIEKLRKPHA